MMPLNEIAATLKHMDETLTYIAGLLTEAMTEEVEIEPMETLDGEHMGGERDEHQPL